jgi:RNA polymerase subunit RPABC4/transcription elongation factor Spt4
MLKHSESGNYAELLELEKACEQCRTDLNQLQQEWEGLIIRIEDLEKLG